MLAPHAVDRAVIISSLIASLCFTFAETFDDIFTTILQKCKIGVKSIGQSVWVVNICLYFR